MGDQRKHLKGRIGSILHIYSHHFVVLVAFQSDMIYKYFTTYNPMTMYLVYTPTCSVEFYQLRTLPMQKQTALMQELQPCQFYKCQETHHSYIYILLKEAF